MSTIKTRSNKTNIKTTFQWNWGRVGFIVGYASGLATAILIVLAFQALPA